MPYPRPPAARQAAGRSARLLPTRTAPAAGTAPQHTSTPAVWNGIRQDATNDVPQDATVAPARTPVAV
jgi:hypothetical protein